MHAKNIYFQANLPSFKFVTCIFNYVASTSFEKQMLSNQKHYTYKTTLDVEPGDFVIVQDPKGAFQTVQVTSILEDDPVGDFEYKWIVQKLDLEHYKQVKTMEIELQELLDKVERDKVKAEKKALLDQALGPKGSAEAKKIIKRTRV